MSKERKPLIRSAASLTNKPRELPPEAIAFAEQASHDQAERGAVAAPAPAPVAAPAAPAAVEPNVGEMTKAKFFHLPNRIIWALKDEALARSKASGQRVTETALVIAALNAFLKK
ncbi:MAG: hypothetical protein KA132_00250 [Thauera sp.]|nr:hypothetical protein [Thauera sp.]